MDGLEPQIPSLANGVELRSPGTDFLGITTNAGCARMLRRPDKDMQSIVCVRKCKRRGLRVIRLRKQYAWIDKRTDLLNGVIALEAE